MIQKTAHFQHFQAGFLDELEKISAADGLTDLEKFAFLGRLGSMLGDWATSGGKALRARALEGVRLGRGELSGPEVAQKLRHRVLTRSAPGEELEFAEASHLPFGHAEGAQLERLGELMRANPRWTGGIATGVPTAAAGAGALGAAMGD